MKVKTKDVRCIKSINVVDFHYIEYYLKYLILKKLDPNNIQEFRIVLHSINNYASPTIVRSDSYKDFVRQVYLWINNNKHNEIYYSFEIESCPCVLIFNTLMCQ